MNKILLFAMLCAATASCMELENICSSDTFEYKGVLVNAFYRVRDNITFESPSHFLIDETVECDLSEFKNKTNFMETLRIKREYNAKLKEYFREILKTNNPPKELQEKANEIYRDGWAPLFKLKKMEGKAKCVESFEKTAYSGWSLFDSLQRLFVFNGYPIGGNAYLKPSTLEAIQKLEKLIEKLKIASGGQTFALGSNTVRGIYFYKQIVMPREFKSLGKGSDLFGLDAKSMAIYDQFLPFNNRNHDNSNCVAVQDLPFFYKEKEKER